MPAKRVMAVVATLIILCLSLFQGSTRNPGLPAARISSLTPSQSSLSSALGWLVNNYGSWSPGVGFEGSMAPAAYALWLNDSSSLPAKNSYEYLESELNNGSSWFWSGPFREADVAGSALFSISASQQLSLLQTPADVSARFLHLQRSDGGFEGLEDSTGHVLTSSVDTAMALWGLSYAQSIPSVNRTAAVNYLLALQNQDGSFNLTKTDRAEQFYSLGPDSVSITAVTILALRESGFGPLNSQILKAITFLAGEAKNGFGGAGHVYDAALSVLAFLQYYHPSEAMDSLSYILTQQNSDGGFDDVTRYTPGSNALDTGWASIAMQFEAAYSRTSEVPVNQPPQASFAMSPQDPTNGTIVSFDAGSSHDSDGDQLMYNWTFGDGGIASGQKVTHSYSSAGVYSITLTVTDSGMNPNFLTGTSWTNLTVQSSGSPVRTATQPSTSNLNLEIGLAILAAAIIAGGYLAIRSTKKQVVKNEPSYQISTRSKAKLA